MRVLMVISDPARAEQVGRWLQEQNLQVQIAGNIADAFSHIDEANYSLIVLENALPDGRGTTFVQQTRTAGYGTPIMVIAATDDPQEEIEALDIGADDVIRVSLRSDLLLARVRSLMRRCEPSEAVLLKYEDLQFNIRSLEVRRARQLIPATSRELAVLEYLMRHPERVISRTELVDAVWDRDVPPESNVVDVFIARLRRKIDRPFGVSLIHTIVNRGYMLSCTRPGFEAPDDSDAL